MSALPNRAQRRARRASPKRRLLDNIEHVTAAARAEMESADELLYLAAEPIAAAFLRSLNVSSRTLLTHPERSTACQHSARADDEYSRTIGRRPPRPSD